MWVFCFLTLWGGLPVLTPCYLIAATKHNHKSLGGRGCRKIYRGFFIWELRYWVMLFSQAGFYKCFWCWIFYISLSAVWRGTRVSSTSTQLSCLLTAFFHKSSRFLGSCLFDLLSQFEMCYLSGTAPISACRFNMIELLPEVLLSRAGCGVVECLSSLF